MTRATKHEAAACRVIFVTAHRDTHTHTLTGTIIVCIWAGAPENGRCRPEPRHCCLAALLGVRFLQWALLLGGPLAKHSRGRKAVRSSAALGLGGAERAGWVSSLDL